MQGGMDGINLAAQDSSKDTVLLEWEGMAFQKGAKDGRWYMIAAGIIGATILYSIWQRDWFAIGVIVIVSAVALWYARSVHPETVVFRITPLGLYVNDRLYPFAEIHSFWIVYNDRVKSLYFSFTKRYLPSLILDIEQMDPIVLRSVLARKVPEQAKKGEDLLEKFARIIGF